MIGVLGVVLCGGLFFLLARRRIGALPALAPTAVLLVLGTAWNVVFSPIGIPFVYATALGLGTLLALERGDRRGDIGACALLAAALATHSIGLSFLVGAAVFLLLREDRLARLWVFLAPLALFLLWWVTLGGSGSGRDNLAEVSNLAGLPLFMLASLGAELTAITGLNLYPYSVTGFNSLPTFQWVFLPVLALVGLRRQRSDRQWRLLRR